MKKYLLIGLFSVILFASSAFASPTIDSVKDGIMNEWVSSGVGYREEFGGYSGANTYDVEKLGLFIDNGILYFGLQTDFDLKLVKDTLDISPGDFIFDFGDDKNTYELALDFSIDSNNAITFKAYSGNIKFNSTTDFKNFSDATTGIVNPGTAPYSRVRPYSEIERDDPNQAWFDLSNNGTPWQAANADSIKTVTPIYSKYNKSVTSCIFDGGHTIEAAINLNDLSDDLTKLFADNTKVTMHWQMECGNDFLKVTENYKYNPVPEPETFLLFGFGLLSLGSVGRYRFNKKA